ncbi:hypothetical protein [Rhizobium sp. 007]|uniref:hypothetical protein n=1 Tax=Rhizobium sp. 007 TaxID=2785056 RepID=UPI00188E058D|nr:hypothetical protein [Rhizobium sp. 007]QPB22390.1 hypothetical protein ISN39_22450 [Rhizobium sp. 007]
MSLTFQKSMTAVVAGSWLFAAQTYAADMVTRNEERAAHVQVDRPYRMVRTTYAGQPVRECDDLLIEYRQTGLTEVVTICHPPVF